VVLVTKIVNAIIYAQVQEILIQTAVASAQIRVLQDIHTIQTAIATPLREVLFVHLDNMTPEDIV